MGHINLSHLLFRDPLPPPLGSPDGAQTPPPGASPHTPQPPATPPAAASQAGGGASYWVAEGAVIAPPPRQQAGPGCPPAPQSGGGGSGGGGSLPASQRPQAAVWTAETVPPELSWAAAVTASGSHLPRWGAYPHHSLSH
jgi:hypothetical protein